MAEAARDSTVLLSVSDTAIRINLPLLQQQLVALSYEFSGSDKQTAKIKTALRNGRFPEIKITGEMGSKRGVGRLFTPTPANPNYRVAVYNSFISRSEQWRKWNGFDLHEYVAFLIAHELRHWVQVITGHWTYTVASTLNPLSSLLTSIVPFLYNYMPWERDANRFARFAVTRKSWLEAFEVTKVKNATTVNTNAQAEATRS